MPRPSLGGVVTDCFINEKLTKFPPQFATGMNIQARANPGIFAAARNQFV